MAPLDSNPNANATEAGSNGVGTNHGDSDNDLWHQFAEATSKESFAAAWLALQCRMIDGVLDGAVFLGSTDEAQPLKPVALWPNDQQNLEYISEVAAIARGKGQGIVLKRPAQVEPGGHTRTTYDIAYPLQIPNRVYGVVTLHLDRPEAQLNDVLRQLQWGCAWMEVLFHRVDSTKDAVPNERLQAVVETIARLSGQKRFQGAASAFVTALATRFKCDRVSIGFLRKGRVRVQALSHSAEFGKDTNLMRAIAAAMEEAIDQQAAVVFPALPDSAVRIRRAHEELSRQYGNGAISSIPIGVYGDVVGALTLERPADQPFDRTAIDICEAIVALAGPILDVQRRDDRWLIAKAVDAGRLQLEHLIGPGHTTLKLITAALVLLLLFFSLIKGDYRVSAKTVVEPATKRAVVAAFNGYVAEAPVRAGDVVRKDQLLCKLDDRELKLEYSKWHSQEEQSLKQYYEALGTRNAPQIQVLAAQVDQAKAQVALIDDQLSRTQVLAPFDGMVVTGDLSQSLGSPVERGQVLFEVAPLELYRIILQVDERDVAEVGLGQRGRIVLSGFPNEPLPFTIEKLTPVSTANEGRNYFRVEARLQSVPERLRPGMEGVGKIEVDRRRLIWIWTHEVVDWVRLKIWQWMP
jgi:biotin carboxyl carrier protein